MMLKDKKYCCGCGACRTVCPTKAITMKSDEEGFLYPLIDSNLCIECGLCQSVCKFKFKEKKEVSLPQAFVATHKSLDVLKRSTSGGVFVALSNYVLNKKGVIYGAAFNDSLVVEHIRATTEEERNRMCGSKYVQSDLKDCYNSVEKDLIEGRHVLFSGTPCQVDGLYVALKNAPTERLLTCDVICFGVSSPKVFSSHIKMLSKKYRSTIKYYECRPAKNGHSWGCSTELAINTNGKEIHSNAWIGLKRRLFYSNIDKRPSCHNCKYCNLDRSGDFSLGDCRNASILIPDNDFFYGVSTLLVNTQKAKNILPELQKEINIWQTSVDNIVQTPLREVSKPSPQREKFWKVFNKKGYLPAIKVCFGKLVVIKDTIRLKLLKK